MENNFNFTEYIKNNPMLKESVNEVSAPKAAFLIAAKQALESGSTTEELKQLVDLASKAISK